MVPWTIDHVMLKDPKEYLDIHAKMDKKLRDCNLRDHAVITYGPHINELIA